MMEMIDAKPIKTFEGKTSGYLRDDGTFISYREEKHIFRKFQGLGLSYKVLVQLRKKGCKKIVFLICRASGKWEKYYCTVSQMLKDGVSYTDRECDHQRILSFKDMVMPSLKNWVKE